MQTIGTTFKNIREERNLLLEDLTKKTGISKAVLSRIEMVNDCQLENR
ncbi:MAG: helix-turn-helix domain-containing protein [Flavobacterium sp.]|nr:helix-turn-helix domain-containing protein [Flavobacterium sp.]